MELWFLANYNYFGSLPFPIKKRPFHGEVQLIRDLFLARIGNKWKREIKSSALGNSCCHMRFPTCITAAYIIEWLYYELQIKQTLLLSSWKYLISGLTFHFIQLRFKSIKVHFIHSLYLAFIYRVLKII